MSAKFAILTSGGDSPGMNCAIRSFVRSGIYHGHQIFGVHQGYTGLIAGNIEELNLSSVGNIIQRGGTVLQSSRSEEFRTAKGRKKAFDSLQKLGIEGLCIIGGDGSFTGAHHFSNEHNFKVVGIPGTIDNDISGTDYTLGHDTAVQTAIEAVDKIRDTAFSHGRVFLIEVMGRKASSLALKVALATGAEDVFLPDEKIQYKKVVEKINEGIKRNKKGSILIVSEGDIEGRSYDISRVLREHDIQSRVCILGHIQRGGSPISTDRIIGSTMGELALNELKGNNLNSAIIVKNGKVQSSPLSKCIDKVNDRDIELKKLISILSI